VDRLRLRRRAGGALVGPGAAFARDHDHRLAPRLETSSANDPAQGVSVNQTLIIIQLYPWAARNVYLKAGYGIGGFQDHHPDGWGSRAFGAVTIGAGYDLRLSRTLFLTLAADWARGPMGSVDNLVTTSTGRRFRAWDVILGVQYH
jgi:hypothetical protein